MAALADAGDDDAAADSVQHLHRLPERFAHAVAQRQASIVARERGVSDLGPPPRHGLRLIGPGRLGISHEVLEPAEAGQRLREWSVQAGVDPHFVANLLQVFMSADHGDICGTLPKCPQCEVRFCKRLRYR